MMKIPNMNALSIRALIKTISLCFLIAMGVTALCWSFGGFIDYANIAMIFLLSTFLAALAFGRGAAVVSAFLNVAFFDFFFVAPLYSFDVEDLQYLITLAVMLIIGLITGNFVSSLKEKIADITRRASMSLALQNLSQGLFKAQNIEQVIATSLTSLQPAIKAELSMYLLNEEEIIIPQNTQHIEQVMAIMDGSVATPPSEPDPNLECEIFIPIQSVWKKFGVLLAKDLSPFSKKDGREQFLQTAADLIALAVLKLQLARSDEASKVEAATERLRSAILSSLSHDLRTPLTKIIGLAEEVQSKAANLDVNSNHTLTTIANQGKRLSNKINNLLEIVKLQTQKPTLEKAWQPIEEVIGTSIKYFSSLFPYRKVEISIDPEIPPLYFDEVLMERVIYNLLDNAAKYSGPDSVIEINARRRKEFVEIEVRDYGSGFTKSPTSLFKAFAKGDNDSVVGGLGLAICKTIIDSHGGTIWAENVADGNGAVVMIQLPLISAPNFDLDLE
ncbi:two-component system sensor histidine kinase KdpD [Polynucleobacter sphagniphilus]|nr:two-component system sensor histidine kinase KdpD [Polynucleobacter sphagniphilus]